MITAAVNITNMIPDNSTATLVTPNSIPRFLHYIFNHTMFLKKHMLNLYEVSYSKNRAARKILTALIYYPLKEENNVISPVIMIANANNTTATTAIVSKMLAKAPNKLATLVRTTKPIIA